MSHRTRLLACFAILAAPASVCLVLAGSQLSGKEWVAKFPGSNKVEDLEADFKPKVEAFLKSVKDGGAMVTISSTLRPKERAYLMHWSWMIVKMSADPSKVPAMLGVDINWSHGDPATSKAKAKEMVDGYQIGNLGVAPALQSRHTQCARAIANSRTRPTGQVRGLDT